MKYDFTTVYDRRGMDALAVDALGQPGGFAPGKPKDGFSVIPMWVADMNFACDFIARHFPGVQVAKPAGTYMLFWTALTGALPVTKRWRTCCTPAGMWARPGRTAGYSTTPAPSA
mgnify:CR=1 FL=1